MRYPMRYASTSLHKQRASVVFLVSAALFNLIAVFSAPATSNDWVYTVVPGDNLWTFSDKYLDSVVRFEELRRMNNIENPRRMRPGTLIRVPMDWIESTAVPAMVYAVSGPATVHRASGVSLALTVGERLFLGDIVRTGKDASIAVRFADGSELNLYSDAEIRFDHLSAHGETGMADSRLHLLKGRLDTRVIPASGPGSRFEIHTPSAISAVRGTDYRAAVEAGSLASRVEVLGGSVAVSSTGGKQLIPKGFGTRVEQGAAPREPKELLAAPTVATLPEPIQTLGWALRWSPQPQAEAYRVQISTSPDFDTLILDELTMRDSFQLPDLADGNYHLRLRAVDAIGLEGRETLLSFTLDARPQPPVLLKPSQEEVLRTEATTLMWSASSEARHYRLQIARDAQFKEILIDNQTLLATTFESAAMSTSARYYWRVQSVASQGDPGPWSPARSFEVRPAHERHSAKLSKTADASLVASWQAAAPGLRYQVQIAFDRGFNDIQMDRVIEEASLKLKPAPSRAQYLRLRSVEVDGYAGPWGATQRIEPGEKNNGWLIPFFVLMILVAP